MPGKRVSCQALSNTSVEQSRGHLQFMEITIKGSIPAGRSMVKHQERCQVALVLSCMVNRGGGGIFPARVIHWMPTIT